MTYKATTVTAAGVTWEMSGLVGPRAALVYAGDYFDRRVRQLRECLGSSTDYLVSKDIAETERGLAALNACESGDTDTQVVVTHHVNGDSYIVYPPSSGPEKIRVLVKRMSGDEDLDLPAYAQPGDAGADIVSAADRVLAPGEFHTFETGIAVALPEGYAMFVQPRSGLAARHGISVVNSPGTVDSGYRGEVKVIVINHGPEPVTIARGERIAQLVFQRYAAAQFIEVDELPTSDRGAGGFGSTGGHASLLTRQGPVSEEDADLLERSADVLSLTSTEREHIRTWVTKAVDAAIRDFLSAGPQYPSEVERVVTAVTGCSVLAIPPALAHLDVVTLADGRVALADSKSAR